MLKEGRARRAGSSLRTWIGIAFSVVAIGACAWFVDWHATVAILRQADPGPIVLATLLFCLSYPVFAARWAQLLGASRAPRIAELFRILMIGFLANATLPGRPGDAIRIGLVHGRHRTGLTASLASLVVERLLDVGVIALFGLALACSVDLPTFVVRALLLVAAATAGLLTVTLGMGRRAGWIRGLPAQHPRLFGGKLVRLVVERVAVFSDAAGLVAEAGRLARVIALTILGWLPQAAGVIAMLYAFHLPVPAVAGLLVIVMTNLGAAIPSSPGNIGVYHSLAILALSVWGVKAETAMAFAICTHTVAIGVHIALGLVCACVEGFGVESWNRIRDANPVQAITPPLPEPVLE